MTWRNLWLCAVLSALLGGCAQTASVPDGLSASTLSEPAGLSNAKVERTAAPSAPLEASAPINADPSSSPYLLDSGDKIRIFVYGQPAISRTYTVDQAGKVSMPLIGQVEVRGYSTYAVERTLRDRLGAAYVRDPVVTVDVQQNRPFFIHGEVRNAGQFPYVSGMTAEAAVAIAGGYSDRADATRVKISRKVGGTSVVTDATPGSYVQPGDVLFVYERFF